MHSILGQKQATALLQSSLRSGRLHHAYIFHGPTGVGKFTTACAFARALLCHNPTHQAGAGVSACGSCGSCRLMHEATRDGQTHPAIGASSENPGGTHPDLHIVTKELARHSDDATVRNRKLTSIPVQVLRRFLLEPVYRAPQLGNRKVFVVDEAELLNPTGQNLLLKTLEEPPPGTYLILITANEDRLLATIRSRCQRVGFGPLPDDTVSHWLDDRSQKLTKTQQSWLVTFASGSLGRADLAMTYDLADWATVILPALDGIAQGRFPENLGRQMTQMIDGFAKRWVDDHDGASKEAANRQGAALLWSIIAQHARQKLIEQAAQCPNNNPLDAEAMLTPWLNTIDALEQCERELVANVNIGLVCDHLVLVVYWQLATGRLITCGARSTQG